MDESECTVSVLDRAFQYSYSVYEALKRKNNKFVHLDEHLKRLNLSAEAIGIENPFSNEELSAWLELLARTEDLENATFRILLFGSDEVKVFINHSPIKVYPDVYYSDGVDVVTYHAERYLPNVKTSNMLPSLLALMSAEKRSAFEALMVDRNNLVLEGTRSNFYGIKDNVIRTAPDDMVLLGVTRLGLIKAAEKYGIRIEEGDRELLIVHVVDGTAHQGMDQAPARIFRVGGDAGDAAHLHDIVVDVHLHGIDHDHGRQPVLVKPSENIGLLQHGALGRDEFILLPARLEELVGGHLKGVGEKGVELLQIVVIQLAHPEISVRLQIDVGIGRIRRAYAFVVTVFFFLHKILFAAL